MMQAGIFWIEERLRLRLFKARSMPLKNRPICCFSGPAGVRWRTPAVQIRTPSFTAGPPAASKPDSAEALP
jgi:hypothetical protein